MIMLKAESLDGEYLRIAIDQLKRITKHRDLPALDGGFSYDESTWNWDDIQVAGMVVFLRPIFDQHEGRNFYYSKLLDRIGSNKALELKNEIEVWFNEKPSFLSIPFASLSDFGSAEEFLTALVEGTDERIERSYVTHTYPGRNQGKVDGGEELNRTQIFRLVLYCFYFHLLQRSRNIEIVDIVIRRSMKSDFVRSFYSMIDTLIDYAGEILKLIEDEVELIKSPFGRAVQIVGDILSYEVTNPDTGSMYKYKYNITTRVNTSELISPDATSSPERDERFLKMQYNWITQSLTDRWNQALDKFPSH